MAGLTEVPAYVRVANDQTMLEMALVENIQREDLNAIEVGLSYQRLIDECSLTQDQLSQKISKSRSSITNHLRLLKLPAEIQAGVRDNVISMGQTPVIQGHRGCRGVYPENSLPAFQHALEMGVTVLEMDVCLSADGKVYVSHEPYMNPLYASFSDGRPVTDATINLYQKTYSEIKSFDVGSRGNRLFPEQVRVATYKPLLSEVLALGEAFARNSGRPIQYNIEIKSEPSEYGKSQPATVKEFADRVWAVISAQISPSSLITPSTKPLPISPAISSSRNGRV
jgi:glycerophosphoryl diester phosphodiesterase